MRNTAKFIWDRQRLISFSSFSFLLIWILWDRSRWASLGQWREDQAVNLWLSAFYSIFETPIGLVSSVGTPNPNGTQILLKPWSLFTSLFALGWTKALLFSGLLGGILYELKKRGLTSLGLLSLATLTSAVLSGASIETWQQVLLMDLTLLHLFFFLRFLRKLEVVAAFGMLWTLTLMPAVYLAGVSNFLLCLLLTSYAAFRGWNELPRRSFWLIGFFGLGLGVIWIWITWWPFLSVVELTSLHAPDPLATPFQRIRRIVGVGIWFPEWIFLFSKHGLAPLFQYDPSIFRPITQHLSSAHVLLSQALSVHVLACVSLFLLKAFHVYFRDKNALNHIWNLTTAKTRTGLACLGWIGGMMMVNSALGNWRWHRGERLDQCIQLLPYFLGAFVLISPPQIPWFSLSKIWSWLHRLIILFWILTQVAASFSIQRDHLNPITARLPSSDTSWRDRVLILEKIAEMVHQVSSRKETTTTIEYRMDGYWAWEVEVDDELSRHYPHLYRSGRAMDYELRKRFQIINRWDGQSIRDLPRATSDFVVAYHSENTDDLRSNYDELLSLHHLRLLGRRDSLRPASAPPSDH